MKLLNQNKKLAKSNGSSYLVRGLTLAPHGLSGHQVCPSATPACRAACVLWFVGHTVRHNVRSVMKQRAAWLFQDRESFETVLKMELLLLHDNAVSRGLVPCCRLNVASDLDWRHIAELFPAIRFYDYTKVRSRMLDRRWPSNYSLTYSVNERSHHRTIGSALRRGQNVAAVFSTRYHPQSGRIDPLPVSWWFDGREWPVVDGDQHDIRLPETDGRGVVVGLRFKGSLRRRALAIRNGFCLDVS